MRAHLPFVILLAACGQSESAVEAAQEAVGESAQLENEEQPEAAPSVQEAEEATGDETVDEPGSEADQNGTAMRIVTECRFEPQCIVDGIGEPTNPAAHAQLIEAYRRMNNVVEKDRLMAEFVERYPEHRLTRRYRREIAH